MSEPVASDQTAVILARMEVKLDNALAEQARHSTTLDRHESRITKSENRLTALETSATADERQQTQGLGVRQLVWGAIGTVSAVAAVVVAVLIAVHGAA